MRTKNYISKDHQKVMVVDGDDDISVESRLAKGDFTPVAADDANESYMSALTEETRDSKAKAYAADATKAVAAQYIGIIEETKTKWKTADNKFVATGKMLEETMKGLSTANGKNA